MRISLHRFSDTFGRALFVLVLLQATWSLASSHREAPAICSDPYADNTDLYAFRSPDDTNTVTIMANYVPGELAEGGPNWYGFGENVQYAIHIDNDAAHAGDEITYLFYFTKVNEDPTTFFNIRLGKQNLKTTYRCVRAKWNGTSYDTVTIVANGTVPPPNIGPRSIEGGAGLNTTYSALMQSAIKSASGTGGEVMFCGPIDDPFFVDLGGIFDLGQTRSADGSGSGKSRDALAGFNCHTIAIKIPIATLQKSGKSVSQAANILDPNFVIGVWASASRRQMTTLHTDGTAPDVSGPWVQVSRLGMPLTNEAVIPIGDKDRWNATNPYDQANELSFAKYFVNPELALYMTNGAFGGAVPALSALKIDTASLGSFDFRNGKDGLYGLYGKQVTVGTALDTAVFGKILLQAGAPRSADILPIFYTGVPNLAPYQLATGKTGTNPAKVLSAGKPFINNFLATLCDELRLNMATPVTDRHSADFSSEGIISAAVLGLTDPRFNASAALQAIPNMDGFPNGRRLEDDVTRIELQAVGGAALAAIGLWYDDYVDGQSPVTPSLLGVLGYTTGVEKNDTTFQSTFPFAAAPHRGYDYTRPANTTAVREPGNSGTLSIHAPNGFFIGQNYPNPTNGSTTLNYHMTVAGTVSITIFDATGRTVARVFDGSSVSGDHAISWRPTTSIANGTYVAELSVNGTPEHRMKFTVAR